MGENGGGGALFFAFCIIEQAVLFIFLAIRCRCFRGFYRNM